MLGIKAFGIRNNGDGDFYCSRSSLDRLGLNACEVQSRVNGKSSRRADSHDDGTIERGDDLRTRDVIEFSDSYKLQK